MIFRLIALKLSPSNRKLLEVRETPRSAMFSTRHERLISVQVSRLVIGGTANAACILDHSWEVMGWRASHKSVMMQSPTKQRIITSKDNRYSCCLLIRSPPMVIAYQNGIKFTCFLCSIYIVEYTDQKIHIKLQDTWSSVSHSSLRKWTYTPQKTWSPSS